MLVCLIFGSTGCTELILPEDEMDGRGFDEVVSSLETPEEINVWLQQNCKYKADESYSDEFLDPEEFFRRKKGDCDDYSRFASYCLDRHGIPNRIISVFTSTMAHAVCVVGSEGRYTNYISSNGMVSFYHATLVLVAEKVYSDWKVYSVYPSNEGIKREVK